jgi:hypothetical protein
MRHHRITRSTALGLALAALAAPTAAAQQQDLRSPDTRDAARSSTAAAPQQDLRSSDGRAVANARSQERSYSSYGGDKRKIVIPRYGTITVGRGEPELLGVSQSPAPSDDTPWLPIALSITGALVIVAASATQLRRLRVRRRRAVRSTA